MQKSLKFRLLKPVVLVGTVALKSFGTLGILKNSGPKLF